MKRWFSLALVLAMCLTTIIGDLPSAIAEDAEAQEYEAMVGDFEEEAPEGDSEFVSEELPMTDDEEDSDPAFTANEYDDLPDGEEGEDALILTDDAETAPEDVVEAVEQPPVLWYARANASLTLEIDETLSRNIPQGSILLVTEQVSETMLHVVSENLSGDVDASLLDALTEEEVQAFMDTLTEIEVSFYEDMPDYPLPPEPIETPVESVDVVEPVEATVEAIDMTEPEEAPSDPVEVAEPEDTKAIESTEESEDASAVETVAEGDDGADPDEEAKEGAEGEEEADSDKKAEDKPAEDGEKGENTEDADTEKDSGKSEKSEDAENSGDDETVKADPEGVTENTEATDAAEKTEGEDGEADESAEDEGDAQSALAEAASAEEGTVPVVAEAGPPAAIVFNLPSLTLGVKEVYTGLTATVVDAAGAPVGGVAIALRSSNIRVAKVAADGRLTAVRNGKATIVASVAGLPDATMTVFVRKAPSKVTVKPKSQKLGLGMALQLVPKLSKGSASGQLTYISSNPAVATVDANGVVTGVGGGKATITVRTYNYKRATCRVTVFGAPAIVTTDKPAYQVLHGRSKKMVINVLDGAGLKTYANLTIASTDPNVVGVNANGLLTGVNPGTATVVITTHNGVSISVPVEVGGPAADMTLSASTITIGVREKYDRLTYTLVPQPGQATCAADVTWKSKNKKIARVNKKTGIITGVRAGTTTIVATTNNRISRSVKVVVRKAPTSVALSPREMALTIGMSGQLTASYNAKNVNNNMTYVSSNPGVAVVDQNGLVTAVGLGSAVITARTYNGKTDTCTVNIYNDPAQVMMTEALTVSVGTRAQLSCSVVDAAGQPSTASYSFSVIPETGAVEVDGNGVVKGVTAGTARVRVSTQNGVTTHLDVQGLPVVTECVVTIEPAPPVRYRVFSVYDFYNVPVKGSLRFPMNNATSFQNVFAGNSIDGVGYENLGVLENPSKQALLSGIASAFSGSRDTDINLIYLCSHGTNYVDVKKTSKSTHYGLQLPGYRNYKSSSEYYVTSEEIFSAISAINGKVILVLDSCYSGQFIVNMRSALDAQNGRISVMTAATNTTACYYNIANTSTACDFFTMYLLMGAGYNLRTHSATGAHAADTNQDGKLTFNELFSYAKKSVRANVPRYRKKSWFHGNYKQSPNVYAGANGDLVLYQYA